MNEVYFERVFNLGNFESMRIGLRATVHGAEEVEKALRALDMATVRYRDGTQRAPEGKQPTFLNDFEARRGKQ